MTIEETDRIDITARRSDGTLVLVISDHMGWEDAEHHRQLLDAKIDSYCEYIRSEDFAAKYPGLAPSQVVILVAGPSPLETDGLEYFAETAKRVAELGVGLDFDCIRSASNEAPNSARPVSQQDTSVKRISKPKRVVLRRPIRDKASREVVVRRIRVAFATMAVGWMLISVYGVSMVLGGREPMMWLRYLGGPATGLAILYACYWMTMRSARPAVMVVLGLATVVATFYGLLFGWLALGATALVLHYWAREPSLRRTETQSPAPKPKARSEMRGRLVLQLWTEEQFEQRSTAQDDCCVRVDLPGSRTVLMVETEELVAPVQRTQAQQWGQPDAALFDIAFENFVRHHRPKIEWSALGSSRVALILDEEHAEFSTAYALTIGRHEELTGPGGALVMMPGNFVVCSPILDRSVLHAALPELLQVAEVPVDEEPNLGPKPVYWWHSGRFHEVGIVERDGKKEITMPDEFWSMLPTLPEPTVRH